MIHECKYDMSYFLQANLDSMETYNLIRSSGVARFPRQAYARQQR